MSSRVLITLAVVLVAVLLITVVSLLVWQLPDPSPVDVRFVDRA